MMILFYSSKFLSKARLCTDSSLDRLAEVAPPPRRRIGADAHVGLESFD